MNRLGCLARHCRVLVVAGALLPMGIAAPLEAASARSTRSARSHVAKRKKKPSTSSRGPRGPIGPQGPAGPQGPGGPQGPAGSAAGIRYAAVAGTAVSTIYQGDGFRLEALCTPGAESQLTLRSQSINGAFRVMMSVPASGTFTEIGVASTNNNNSYLIGAPMGWIWFLAPDGGYTNVQYSILDNTNQNDCAIVGFVNFA